MPMSWPRDSTPHVAHRSSCVWSVQRRISLLKLAGDTSAEGPFGYPLPQIVTRKVKFVKLHIILDGGKIRFNPKAATESTYANRYRFSRTKSVSPRQLLAMDNRHTLETRDHLLRVAPVPFTLAYAPSRGSSTMIICKASSLQPHRL